MSQTETPKAEGAEERTEETRSFVRRVRTATRRKYTPEEKIRIVRQHQSQRVSRRGVAPCSPTTGTRDRCVRRRDCSGGFGSPNKRIRRSNVPDQRPRRTDRRLSAGRLAGAQGREQTEDDDCGSESRYVSCLSRFSANRAGYNIALRSRFPVTGSCRAGSLSWYVNVPAGAFRSVYYKRVLQPARGFGKLCTGF